MRNLRHFFLVILASLFMGMQSFALAHTTEYSDPSHTHDGVECSITALAKPQSDLTDPPLRTGLIRAEIKVTYVNRDLFLHRETPPAPKAQSPPYL